MNDFDNPRPPAPTQVHGLAYLATPFTKYPGGIEKAWEDAAEISSLLATAGVRVFSPVVYSYGLCKLGGIDPLDLDFWLDFLEPHMAKADALIVARLPGWDSSSGVKHEIRIFTAAHKPIFDLEPASMTMRRREK